MGNFNYGASMFIGTTTRGVERPVFFDTQTPPFNNLPPGIIVTGNPGTGKTFLGLTITTLACIAGKTTVVIDPKGDFLSLVNLREDVGPLSVWNLTDKTGASKAGLLDPMYMADNVSDKLSLTVSVIDIFVGGLSDDQMTVLSPILKDVIDGPNPSMQKIVDELRGSVKSEARNLGTKLDLIKNMNYAKLCFAPGNAARKSVNINDGLTIVTLAGMPLPRTEDEAKSNQGRLATGLMFLLTDFIRRIMENDESGQPKLLVIDEARFVLSNSYGASIVESVALMGRSKNIALLLMSQSNSHFEHLNIETTISTRFAFKSSVTEGNSIVKDMGLPKDEGFGELISKLNKGECLMQDFRGRYSTVQISDWNKKWADAFNSNPLDKLKKNK